MYFNFIIESFILCAVSLFSGAAAYIIISRRLFTSREYLVSNLVDVTLGRESVYFLIDNLQVNDFIKRYKAGLVTTAVTLIFFLTIYAFDFHTRVLLLFNPADNDPGNFNFLHFTISLILIGIALYIFSPSRKLNRRLRSTLNETIKNVQSDYEEVRKLKRIIPQIRKSAGNLHVFFPVNYIPEIQKEIKSKTSSIFIDISLVKKIINNKIEVAVSDKNELEKASRLYNNFLKFYQKVSSNILKTNSISHINQLNHLSEMMEEYKSQLLIKRKWTDFQSITNDFLLALDELNGLALRYIYEEENKQTEQKEEDAYALLEVSKEMTDEEIKRKWKQLLEEFHPDKADNTTDGIRRLVTERAQAINNAFNKIKEERNIR